MSRPRLLDLFSCAGGAGRGYQMAGFHVTGVDIKPQPRYAGDEFVQGDALEYLAAHGHDFDAIHASPPCQGYSAMRHAPGTHGAPLLISQTRAALRATNRPWVIENVEGARSEMRDPITLCGSMFDLGAQGCRLQRHRLFETSASFLQPPCWHEDGPVIGIYGGHARRRAAAHGGRGTRDVWSGGHRQAASEAMGIDWMTLEEMSEAIPPAYTEFIGRHLIAALTLMEASA